MPAALDSPDAAGNLSDTNLVFSLGATNGLDDQADETMTSTTSKWHKNTLKVLDILKNNF